MREALATEAWLGFQIQGTGSNRLSIFLSILFSKSPNSGVLYKVCDWPHTNSIQFFS